MRNIYEEAKRIMNPEQIDHHESDLYLMVTSESKKLVSDYEYKFNVKTFISAIAPHVLWYDIPFAFPYDYQLENRKEVDFIIQLNKQIKEKEEV